MLHAEARECLLEGLAAVDMTFGHESAARLVFRRASDETVITADEIAGGSTIDPFTISMTVRPSTDDHFVQFVVRVTVSAECLLESVDIREQKGLDCATEKKIQTQLSEKARSEGDLMTLMFFALELAEEHNAPHGNCSFCLEALEAAESGDISRMACFHCFHSCCFWEWFDWRQRQLARKVEELTEDHNQNKAIIAKAMEDADIELVEGKENEYILQCPNCRERLWPLPDRAHDGVTEQRTGKDVSLSDLPEEVRRKIKDLQIRQGEILEQQRSAGGVIV